MFGISGEHLLILGIVLLIFGPRRLPELGNTLGKAIRNFKDAVSGVEEAQFRRVATDDKTDKATKPAAVAQTAAQPDPAIVKPDAAIGATSSGHGTGEV